MHTQARTSKTVKQYYCVAAVQRTVFPNHSPRKTRLGAGRSAGFHPNSCTQPHPQVTYKTCNPICGSCFKSVSKRCLLAALRTHVRTHTRLCKTASMRRPCSLQYLQREKVIEHEIGQAAQLVTSQVTARDTIYPSNTEHIHNEQSLR